MGKGSVCGVYTSLKPMIHFDSKQSQSIFNQNYYKNAMANNCKQCSIRIISHTTTPVPKAYDCVAVYISGRRTSLVVYGWWPQPPTKNTKDCQKLKFYQIHTNSNINQCFPKQFWCWSWRNGLDYSNITFFVVYGKSPQGITQSCTILSQPPTAMLSQWLGRRECRLRLCNSLCRTELILLA